MPEKVENTIKKIRHIPGKWFVLAVTGLVFVLLFFTAYKLIAYALMHPLHVTGAKEKAFDMVMVHRDSVEEEKRDEWLKMVNKAPHIFLRAVSVAVLPENGAGTGGKGK